jgi:GTP cyclohydrolase IA
MPASTSPTSRRRPHRRQSVIRVLLKRWPTPPGPILPGRARPYTGGKWAPVLACPMLMKTDPDQTPATPPSGDEGVPVSVKIRERLKAARQRFHSNDNIAEFIQPGELEKLLDEVTEKMQGVLESMVIDTESDHNTGNTARRVAKMYLKEVFAGRYVKGPSVTEFPNAEHLNELMIVGPITVRSACSHHFCPVIGKLWIGVMPNEHTNVIGLSKYARLAEWIMGRPQIQEEAVIQLADLIQEKTQPDGLAIVMEASHYCMAWRGVKDMNSKMINSVMRGVFLKDANLRREFLALVPR